ncbi:MAG: DivIVA domain-containing protein [Acidobacteriota bacterium]|nr:DivIVA domain-containing protein [Acidobacteriota bacterium]
MEDTSTQDRGQFERRMRITPLDLRQQRFKVGMRGFDKTEVVAFLTEAADDYELVVREMDRLRGETARMESLLNEHRSREANLRDTLVTAQQLSQQVREQGQKEAKLIVDEAQKRAALIIERAHARLQSLERDITEMHLRRRDTEGTLEASIQALYRALEFVREQGDTRAASEEKILLHRPRADRADGQAEPDAAPADRTVEAGS